MNAKRVILFVGACALVAAAQPAFATDLPSGASAQVQTGTGGVGANAQVGPNGASAGAQVGTPSAMPQMPQGTGTGTQVHVQTNSGSPMTGQLTVKDPTLRTFVIGGQEQVYVAPETVDIEQFQGKDVVITFDPNGRVVTIMLDRES